MDKVIACKTKTVTLLAKDGLHTRPAAQLVQLAKNFNSDIFLEVAGKSSSAKSLFKLQLLELTCGCDVSIRAEGDDAHEAVEELASFLSALQ